MSAASGADARLLDALEAAGELRTDHRRLIERERVADETSLEELLVDGGFVDGAALARHAPADARAIDLDGDDFVPDARAVARLDAALAHRLRVVPLALDADGTTLTLASDGVPELPRRDALRRALPASLGVVWRVASARGVARGLDRCYGAALALEDVADACERGEDVARLVDAYLSDAVAHGASDIHFSPEERFVRVRYRIDGVLVETRSLARARRDALVVRLKVLAGADIAETRRPQDGRFSRRVHGRRVDFRLSCFPLAGGESLVLRVLERRRAAPALADLAQPPATLSALRRLVHRPDGLVVVCGPTGSGKTTTLYALLGERDPRTLNAMTLEDPIEHRVPGVAQAALDPARGLDYASGVRALLRQDPDVLLIGEVRDAASCAMALRAALTGHQVLTTVHANDALGAIERLRELGAEPGTLAAVLAGVVAQRLLRTRCAPCGGSGAAGGARCPRCAGRRLSGRRAVLETLEPGTRFTDALAGGASGRTLARAARADGHVTLPARARALLERGVTTSDELERVLGPHAAPSATSSCEPLSVRSRAASPDEPSRGERA